VTIFYRLTALAGVTIQSSQDGSTSRSQPPPLSLLLQASADSSALANAVLVSAKFHSPSSTEVIIASFLSPSLTSLSSNGRNLYSAAAKAAGVPHAPNYFWTQLFVTIMQAASFLN
jgi:RsiW-degrading membrane proteinase PrsW (M82 family)